MIDMVVQMRGAYQERVATGKIDRLSWEAGKPVQETVLLV